MSNLTRGLLFRAGDDWKTHAPFHGPVIIS